MQALLATNNSKKKMSLTPLFVSAETIKKYGIIEDNVDVKLINSTTLMVQDIQLQQILGSSLYKEICTQINASTISANNTILLDDFIRNYLLNSVIAEGCITFLYRFSNKAVVTSNSENQFPITETQVNKIEERWRNQAKFYAKRLSEYLCENATIYPLYQNGNTNQSDIKPKTPRYGTSIYLGNARRKN